MDKRRLLAAQVCETGRQRADAVPVEEQERRRQFLPVHNHQENIAARRRLVQQLLQHSQVKIDSIFALLILQVLVVELRCAGVWLPLHHALG